MGVTERKQREKEQKIRDLVAAAEKCFFSKGIANTTMDEIAKCAEYSKGTLYLYFKNKEELASAVLIDTLGIMTKVLTENLCLEKSGLENVRELALGYFNFFQIYPKNFEFMMEKDLYFDKNDDMPYTQKCYRAGDNALEAVADIIKKGIADGSIRDNLDPNISSIIVWGQLHGIITVSVKECHHNHLFALNDIGIEGVVKNGIDMVIKSLEN